MSESGGQMANKKAEAFKKFISEHDNAAFGITERPDAPGHPVLFHSRMIVNDREYPIIVTVDDSVFVTIRLLLDRAVVTDEHRASVIETMNRLNFSFKAFKHYVDQGGSMVLDSCLIMPDQMDGSLIYNMLAMMEEHLKHVSDEIRKAAGIDEKEKKPDLNFVK
jgi:hypothetical protein